jgi:molybdopterin synthase catalytic subunit
MHEVRISSQPLDIAACIAWATTPGCGAINAFIGTVRDTTEKRKVMALEFEAYEKMALLEMKKIAEDVLQKWPVEKILIHHRTGILQISEVPVVIVVAARHRDVSFEACRHAIDTLKQTVPIWKKEKFEDGEVWVAAHP